MKMLYPARSLAVVLSLLSVVLLLAAGCDSSKSSGGTDSNGLSTAASEQARNPADDYVGSAACADCHQKEFQSHRASRHAKTLHTVDRQSLGDLLPPLIPNTRNGLAEENGRIVQRIASKSIPLDLVLGSGKVGMTYIAIQDPSHVLETKKSYFPRWHRWDVTPGQDEPDPTDTEFGRVHDPNLSARCIGCHAVTAVGSPLKPDPKFFGVGCESCHGPGREHIALLRAGDRLTHPMVKLGQLGGTQLNFLCGKCHRNLADVNLNTDQVKQTQRFQPFALAVSQCRDAKGEALACIRCHDPHTDVSKERAQYESACLKCHASGAQTNLADGALKSKVCPVNATTKCVSCHMREKPLLQKSDLKIYMVDHLISIPPKK